MLSADDVLAELQRATPVSYSTDLARVLHLPMRAWTPAQIQQLQHAWSTYLRAPGGTQTLFPVQAQSFAEMQACNGLFAPIKVAGGKSLISFLAFTVLCSIRPLLVEPAKLEKKTHKEIKEAAQHWKIHRGTRITSYEMLSRPSGVRFLDDYKPDVIVFDECQRIKNLKAACAARVDRYMKAYPQTRIIVLSGTMVKDGIINCWHLAKWSLRNGSPFPIHRGAAEEWACALDLRMKPGARRDVGELIRLAIDSEEDELTRARKGVFQRMHATAGVVCTAGEGGHASISIEPIPVYPGPVAAQHFDVLRKENKNPDGKALVESLEVFACARQLAMGFHYYLHPTPPAQWVFARSHWAAWAREIISSSRTIDTELFARKAVEEGKYPDAREALQQWVFWNSEYRGTPHERWHDTTVLEAAAKWTLDGDPTLVWSEHTAFGRALAKRLGVPFVHTEGLLPNGQLVDTLEGKQHVVLSIRANGEGRNLQAWHRNLICSPEGTHTLWEQTIGRTDRPGQKSDEIEVGVIVACTEHERALEQASGGATMANHMLGSRQKILEADWLPLTHDEKKRREHPAFR